MSSLHFACPHCANLFQTAEASLGQDVVCPTCGNVVSLPSPNSAAQQSMGPPRRQSGAQPNVSSLGPEPSATCPRCQGQFVIPQELVGKPFACPHCRQSIEVAPTPPRSEPPQLELLQSAPPRLTLAPSNTASAPLPHIEPVTKPKGTAAAADTRSSANRTSAPRSNEPITSAKISAAPPPNKAASTRGQSLHAVRNNRKQLKNLIVFGVCILVLLVTLYLMI